MDIIFYKLQDEANDVKKTRTLTATQTYTPKIIQGYLRGSTSKITPSIEFASDITQFNDWNYCYIADFKRYYFVMDVISVRAGVTAVDLKVDVLTSFLTQANIGTIEGFVVRSAKATIYDRYIPDRKVQFKIDPKLTIFEPTSRVTNIENITFDVSNTVTNNIVASICNIATPITFDISAPIVDFNIPTELQGLTKTSTLLGEYSNPRGACITYVMSPKSDALYSLICKCSYQGELSTFVYNLMAFPFTIPNRTTNKSQKLRIHQNLVENWLNSDTSIDVDVTTQFNSGFLVLKDFELSLPSGYSNANFIDFEPYTKAQIYIPFCSWIDINIRENIYCRLMVIYNVNYVSGVSTVILYNQTKGTIIYENTVQLGVRYPFSATNMYDLANLDTRYTSNLTISMIGGALSMVGGVITQNPLLAGAGMLSMTKGVADYGNNENTLIPKSNSQVINNTGDAGVYGGLKVLVKFTQADSINFTSSTQANYTSHLGLPSNKIKTLSDLVDSNNYHTYAEIIDLHTTTESGLYSLQDITSPEIDELKRLCAEGIYL